MNQYITKLDLASNGLGDKGVLYLSQILRDNAALEDINLSQNFIGVDGVRELCDLFKQNHITINHLNLDGMRKDRGLSFIYLKNFHLSRKFIK
jgi:Ran GTPase-activating protein (RanGAP) involved in mRNA processing and transport